MARSTRVDGPLVLSANRRETQIETRDGIRLFGEFMSLDTVGLRCARSLEPDQQLDIVAEIDPTRVTVEFAATRERRI
jgi:hypothetical protein